MVEYAVACALVVSGLIVCGIAIRQEVRNKRYWRERALESDALFRAEVERVISTERSLVTEREVKYHWHARAGHFERLVEVLNEELARYHRIVEAKDELIAEMKREGFAPPVVVESALEAFTVKLPEEILMAVDQMAPEGTQIRHRVLQQAEELYQRDVEAEAIIAEITAGSDLNPHHL